MVLEIIPEILLGANPFLRTREPRSTTLSKRRGRAFVINAKGQRIGAAAKRLGMASGVKW